MGDSEGLRVEATKLTLEIKQFIKRERIASPGSMQDTGSLGLVHWDDPEGWYGAGGGRGVQDGEHVYTQDRKSVV